MTGDFKKSGLWRISTLFVGFCDCQVNIFVILFVDRTFAIGTRCLDSGYGVGKKMIILAGDVGATKTVMGLFETGAQRPALLHSATFSSKDYPSLESIVEEFLLGHDGRVESACFGAPGPVLGGVCRTTNLDWVVSSENLKNSFNIPIVTIVNDLVATAMAAPTLYESECVTLNEGKREDSGTIGVVAPGTGLGMALMVRVGQSYHPVASEGGHVDFAPTDAAQISLLQHMLKKFGRVSVERIAAGPGLIEIFNWLALMPEHQGDPLLQLINMSDNPSALINRYASEDDNTLCSRTLDMYVSILGSISGNLALTAMTTGGMYLGGGVSPKILPRLVNGAFMSSFTNKGRFGRLMESIPVKIILNDRAALTGASICAAQP